MKKVHMNQIGDTIVEVLIAIAVVSAVLGGAYTASSRSLSASRQAQERGEALKLAEGQMESLKVAATIPGSGVFTTTRTFCLDGTAVVENSSPSFNPNNLNSYDPRCGLGTDQRYKIAVSRDGSGTFTITARWIRFGGNSIEELPMVYRVYP